MKNNRGVGIVFKMVFFTLTGNALVFLALFFMYFRYTREIVLNQVEQNVETLAYKTANQIDKILVAVQKVPENVALTLKGPDLDRTNLLRTVRLMVQRNPEIYGGTIAFEPYGYDPNELYFAPYCYQKGATSEFVFLGGDDYRYFQFEWYALPKELDRPVWIEPYFDKGGGNILMSTYSVPFYSETGDKNTFRGVVTADVSLERLQGIVSSIRAYDSGYGFLIARNGTVVTYPGQREGESETLDRIADACHDNRLKEIGREMTAGNAGFVPYKSTVNGKDGYLHFLSLPTTGWSMGIFLPKDELMADIVELNRSALILVAGGILMLSLVVLLISRNITRPLRTLSNVAEEIASGNLDITVPEVRQRDEVGRLAGSFLHMKDSLKEHIRELTETTAVRERMESELRIGRDIQMGLLPKMFSPSSGCPGLDIYARLAPAREVGGDLYDFYFLDPERLFLVIGDVSDKGVPASLLMAMTKTLIKVIASGGALPAEILARVNDELSADNDSCMFVTVFCAILNVGTGQLLFANGGHEPPVLIRKDGGVVRIQGGGGLPLGMEMGSSYTVGSLALAPDDEVFLYTDGVTDALNEAEERFSDERLLRELDSLKQEPIHVLVDEMMKRVARFSEGVPQTDDITMMVLRYPGSQAFRTG